MAISEIVEAVRRHGWPSVTVDGDMDFRVAATKALLALEPPVRVVASILSEFEEAEIEDARAAPHGLPSFPSGERTTRIQGSRLSAG